MKPEKIAKSTEELSEKIVEDNVCGAEYSPPPFDYTLQSAVVPREFMRTIVETQMGPDGAPEVKKPKQGEDASSWYDVGKKVMIAGAVAGAVVATGGAAAGAAGMMASAGGMTAAAGSVAAAGTAAKVAAGAAGAATAAYVGNKMMNSNEESKLYKEITMRPEQPLQLQSAQLSEPGYTLIVLFLRNFILNAHRGLDASTDARERVLAAQKKFKRCSPSRRATTAAKLLPQRGSLRRRTSGCAQKSRCTWSGGRWRTSSCIQRRGLEISRYSCRIATRHWKL